MSTNDKPKRTPLTPEQQLERARARAAELGRALLVPEDVRKDLRKLDAAVKIAEKYNAADYAKGFRVLRDSICANAIAAAQSLDASNAIAAAQK